MRARCAAVLSVALSVLQAGPLGAQHVIRPGADSTATVPAELALALTSSWMGFIEMGTPAITVGAFPASFPRDLTGVARGRVLGGMTYQGGEGPLRGTSIAIVASDAAPDAARDTIAARLERSGWRRPPVRHRGGGFVMSHRQDWGTFCRDSLALSLSAAPRAAGGSHVRMSLAVDRAGGRYRSSCDPAAERHDRAGAFAEIPMPALVAPSGVEIRHAGSTGDGERGLVSSTRARTSLAPAQLVAHYAAQLREAGWTVGAPLADGPVAVQAARLTDEQGRAWQGVLVAMGLPAAGRGEPEVEVSFRVARSGDGES